MNDRITLRLGDLAGPLSEAATASGRSVSEEIRHRLARSLRVAAPEMAQGFAVEGAGEAAATKRWKKKHAGRSG